METKKIEIIGNIGYEEINRFVDYYQEVKRGDVFTPELIEIIFNPIEASFNNGHVDPIYLSYLMLFLDELDIL